jgi:hypothetical protein
MKTLDKEIEASLLTPLYDAYHAFLEEDSSQAFRKVHRLIDLIEVFCKLYTAASMATFLHTLRNRMDDGSAHVSEESLTKIKVMLAAGLKTPSLGIWWKFARDISSILHELNIPHILPGAEKELLNGKSSIKKAFDGEKNLITFRNKYAHGATPNEKACSADLNEVWPRMLKLLADAVSLRSVDLVICTEETMFLQARGGTLLSYTGTCNASVGHTFFCSANVCVDAYPILSFKKEKNETHFFFYNDMKDKWAGYLNYPNAEHIKNVKEELLSYIPIDEWKNIGNTNMDPFRQQIELLTEVFKGRKDEFASIASFLSDEASRFLCVWGPPGVGKSALLARVTQILRCDPDIRETLDDGIQWPEIKVKIVEYFIRRGATETASQFFDSMNERLDQLYQLRFEFGKSDSEKQGLFLARIEQISKQLKEDECLLLIADGLDEIKNGDPLLSLLPKMLPEKIKIIYGARPQQELRYTFYDHLDRERRASLDVGGLSLADIRSVLMEHVSKYEIRESYVDEVLRISEGNPLYLKMLCSGLEQRIYKLNSAVSLPKGMDELYTNALLTLEKSHKGATNFLIYLAAAKDFVSPELAAEWIEVDTPYLRNSLLSACLEFLYENPLTQELEDYQLFHESLREFLTKTYPTELQACKERICDWSLKWRLNNGDIAFEHDRLGYAMHFATEHLFESYIYFTQNKKQNSAIARKKQLFDLIGNEEWRAMNFETCGNGEALGRSYYFLQRILAVEDSTGNHFKEFFNYAYNRYAEPERMYKLQRALLMTEVPNNKLTAHLERIPSLAKMGQRDEDKVLLALLPLWSNENLNDIPVPLRETLNGWLENTRSSAVKKLWMYTQNKRLNTH